MIFPVVVWLSIGPYQFDYVAMNVNRTDKELSCQLAKPIRIEGADCNEIKIAAIMPMENGLRVTTEQVQMTCVQDVQAATVTLSCQR